MRFRIVRLTAIRNWLKRIIYVSSELGLVRMVSELVTGWCASEDARPSRGVDCEISHRLEKGTIHFWKLLSNRYV